MRFTFDPRKRAANLRKHGFDLADAQAILESDAAVSWEDRRFDYGEERFLTAGPLDDHLVVIVTAETADEIRVISMREASKNEKTFYRKNSG